MPLVLLAGLLGGAFCFSEPSLEETNAQLAGTLIDYTHNHGCDRRIYSPVLGEKRDLFVYLPPGYDPSRQYALIVFMHGGFGDETAFARVSGLTTLDRMITCGKCPPVIVMCPDATITGENGLLSRHSFFVNGVNGRFEDHLLQEVIPFVMSNYSVQADREAHILCGYSGGGFPAFSLAIRYQECFGIATSVAGPLNLRYTTKNAGYFGNFSPSTFQWQTDYRPKQKITRYYGGLLHLPAKFFVSPVFGMDDDLLSRVKPLNPADLVANGHLAPGTVKLAVYYAGRDNFNFDAQSESFIWLARRQGIKVDCKVWPKESHTSEFCTIAQIEIYRWLADKIPQPIDAGAGEESVPVARNERLSAIR